MAGTNPSAHNRHGDNGWNGRQRPQTKQDKQKALAPVKVMKPKTKSR
jgi:hypothetical protein